MHTYLCLNYCWLFGTGTQVTVHQKGIQGKRYRVYTQVPYTPPQLYTVEIYIFFFWYRVLGTWYFLPFHFFLRRFGHITVTVPFLSLALFLGPTFFVIHLFFL